MNKVTRFLFVVVVALLGLFAQTSLSDSCSTHSNCSSCASTSGCMWVLLYNCMEECIRTDYSDPEGIKMKNVIWRSEVRNETQCPNKEECEIMEGNVPNPSFEDWSWKEYSNKVKKQKNREGETIHDPWIFTRIISVENCTSITGRPYDECRKTYYTGFDGDFFLYMGGASVEGNVLTYEVKLDNNLKISKNATHLSFFYALPYYSDISKSVHFYPFKDRTALDVFIDGEHVFRLDKKNINETMYRESGAFYHPMNIDVSGFADDNKHSLILYFTEEKHIIDPINASNNPIQAIFIDYIQVIKSNLNGSTFDGWEGAPFNSRTSCETYCHSEYIGDGVCDRVCLTNECQNDGGDCEISNSNKLSTEAVLGIVFGVTGGLIIIALVVLFIVVRRKTIFKSSSRSGNLEMKNKKKGWSVSTKNIMFGGKEADIGIALKDTLTVINRGKPRTFTVTLLDESRCNSDMKFKIVMKPREFYLEKNEEQTVNIFIKIFCTTTITERIEIKTDDSTEEIINLVASGKKSTRINPYDLLIGDVVGEGSFGVVHQGIYKNTYDVAVKKLKVIDEGTIEDFNKEADILEKIDSEYTVKFYGALVTEDYYCLVTEFVSYGSLSTLIPKIIQADPNGGKRILCALNIAKALKYLHENNILHRDLKPENVLVSSNTIGSGFNTTVVCKLTDFGTSKILQSKEEGNMTRVIGTPMYMAPEVINTNTYGRESDIYSFGASFFELWLGEQPFSAFIGKIASGELSLTFTPDPSCPQEIVNLINKCLNKEQEHRPNIDTIISVLEESWLNLYPQISDLSLFH